MEELSRRDRLIGRLTKLVKQVVAAGGQADLIVMNPGDAELIEMEQLEGARIKADPQVPVGRAVVVGEGWNEPPARCRPKVDA